MAARINVYGFVKKIFAVVFPTYISHLFFRAFSLRRSLPLSLYVGSSSTQNDKLFGRALRYSAPHSDYSRPFQAFFFQHHYSGTEGYTSRPYVLQKTFSESPREGNSDIFLVRTLEANKVVARQGTRMKSFPET